MRIRQVKPEFWSDSRIGELNDGCRLFFIGLWMLADDDGWLRWDEAEAGRALFGYESRAVRERKVSRYLDDLRLIERVELYDCGHAFVPHLTEHQRFAGETKRVHTFAKQHLECPDPRLLEPAPRVPAVPRGFPPIPAPVSNWSGSGQVEDSRDVVVVDSAPDSLRPRPLRVVDPVTA